MQKSSLQKDIEQELANQTQLIQKLNDKLIALRHERHQNYINSKKTTKKKYNSCLLTQEFTLELNEKSSNGSESSNKSRKSKCTQEKLENQIIDIRKSHHQKYQKSRVQKNNNSNTDRGTISYSDNIAPSNKSNLHK